MLRFLVGKILGAPAAPMPQLHFKGPDEALRYACEHLKIDHATGAILPCVIQDVSRTDEGLPIAQILTAGRPAATPMLAVFPTSVQYPEGYIGALCAAQLGPMAGGMRTAMVVAELSPSWDSRGWKMKEHFRPT